jgi:biopolymer transport protein ExbD
LDTASIAAVLRGAVARDPDHQVLIEADRDLKYQAVVDVIDLVRGAGITKYALQVVRP